MKEMKKGIVAVIVLCFMLLMITGCSDSSGSTYNGYSDDYNNDSDYKSNVDYIGDVFGEDSKDVDAMLQGLEDALN